MTRWTMAAAAAILTWMSGALAQAPRFEFPADTSFIFSRSNGESLLHQCSRKTPGAFTDFWEPSPADIGNLEKHLAAYLASLEKAGAARPPFGSYNRQYIGVLIRDKRLIYGNYYPTGLHRVWEKGLAAVICDGGPSFWGILFNPQTNEFTDLEFNEAGVRGVESGHE